MNRLVTAHRCKIVVVAMLSTIGTFNASAQAQAPPIQPAPPLPHVSSGPPVSLQSGQKLLHDIQAAIVRRDYHTAVQSFRQVAAMTKIIPQLGPSVQQLKAQLQEIGIAPALLAMPPQGVSSQSLTSPLANSSRPLMQRLPDVAGAQPITTASGSLVDRKKEALRFVAVGRAALDRGDITSALTAARQAEALQVPEKDFAAGEPRVWQLVLDAESSARRAGIALASNVSPTNAGNTSPVQLAHGTMPQGEANVIAQMFYNADADTKVASPSVKQVQNVEALPPSTATPGKSTATQGNVGYAQRMYSEGLEALGQGDSALARKRFSEAWKYEAELAPAQRSQLKNKLTLLQPKRMAPTRAEQQELSPIQRAELAAKENTRRLLREVTVELVKAGEQKTSAPLDALDQLERLQRRVDGSDVDAASKRSLGMMVDRAITQQKSYNQANRAKIELDLQNESVRTEMATDRERDARVDEEVSSLVETYNDLMQEKRFPEAEVIAKQVAELKPEDPISISMFHNSRMGTRIKMSEDVRHQKENGFLDSLHDLDVASIAPNSLSPMTLPDAQTWEQISIQRLNNRENRDSRLSTAEQEIKRKLTTPVSVKYANRPLGEVLDELAAMTGIPIVVDQRALSAVRVTTETPVSLAPLDSIALKSVLNLVLRNFELTYVIENDVLSITSEQAKQTNVYPQLYRVTDLVTPIPNFTSSYEDGLAGALRAAYQRSSPQSDVHVMPVSMMDLGSGMANSMSPAHMGPDVLGQYNSMGSQGGFGLNNPPGSGSRGGGAGGSSFADFQSLIELIQTTVVPDTWEALGGPSTMAPYPQNLSLVISTTSDVHDQISDLLESLRRLQNLQITIEVRFITLADTFAEQIGVDFDVQFDDNLTALPSGEDSGPSVAFGFNGVDGLPTADLDIRFDNGSFGLNPPFGAAGLGTPSTIGFAILSDIEAFFFLQAAQADNRSNVMQAPKVTMFDGQFATISDVSQRPFVTSITPVVGDFAVAQQPVIVVLNEGTQLNVQGIVSDDKRFVRLTLVPFFSQIGAVDTFTFEGRRTTRNSSRDEEDTNGDGVVDDQDAADTNDTEDVVEGTTVQLPTFAFTSVSTTVSVPDGGTILLGGIKRLSEGRVERGVPVLSKIPYLSRLFRNVSAGRNASSLMLMVTPRIIIQEEEELAQTGFDPNRK